MGDDRCDHELGIDIDKSWAATRYFCELVSGHNGLHRWSSAVQGSDTRARVWTDEGIDFLEGPYTAAADPASPTCSDSFTDAEGAHILCVRPKGHLGDHGNYHDEYIPTMWTNVLNATYGTLAELAKTPEGAHSPARFEIVINGGTTAVAKKVRLNGMELPNVHDLSIEYGPSTARTVIIEILATDVVEVPDF